MTNENTRCFRSYGIQNTEKADTLSADYIKSVLPDLTVRESERFYEFSNLLLAHNKKYNLTALLTPFDIAVKHIGDSLIANSVIPYGASVLDVGSGGGFPGIPLGIIREDITLTLLEANTKKAEFLALALKAAEIENGKVINARAEQVGVGKAREKYSVTLARAVAPLPLLMELCAPLTALNGKFIAYKGAKADEEILAAENAAKTLGMDLHSVIRYDTSGARALAVYVKTRHTPPAYPRQYNKIKSKPL